MRDNQEAIEAAGARLIAIGSGRQEHARDFRAAEGVNFQLLVDPELEAYAAAELRRPKLSALNLRSLRNSVRALRGGFKQTGTRGDAWQVGGTFVIGPSGVRYAHRSREAGDHAPMDQVLAALGER